uniref:Uncharacterized protein n=1 Tax=viral metagenome TaxID=1070528 RepID=A0A6M3M7W2_9ZZZZ
MAFLIKGKVKGDKEVVKALNYAPRIFLATLSDWLRNERANMLGGKDAKGKTRKGYRDILARKTLRKGRTNKGKSKWSRRVTGLFKGYIPFAKNINDLSLKMGVISRSKHQLIRALEFLETGGTITSGKPMIVPMYKNLARVNQRGPWTFGDVKTGLKSKVFNKFVKGEHLITIKKNGRLYFFNKHTREKQKRGFRNTGFLRKDLLFMGLFGVRVNRQLKGRYDFYGRFDHMQGAMVRRGQTSVDRATKKVERVK